MKPARAIGPDLYRTGLLLLPLALWAMLILSLQSGNLRYITDPGNTTLFVHAIRATFPFLAAFSSVVIILVKGVHGNSGVFPFFGPLGFAALYGLVGIASSLFSPDGSVALFWAVAYLSVPLVLWAIVWGSDALDVIQRIVKINWLIITLVVALLFTTALLYLDLGSLILTPSFWLDCKLYRPWHGDSWLALTSGFLRPTGVGRYAAMAAIIALSGLWQGRGRIFWWSIFLASLILLGTSGARGAFLGFAGAAPLVVVLHGGKRAAAVGALAVLLLAPIVWSTGVHQVFLEQCIFRSSSGGQEASQAPKPYSLSQRVAVPLPAQIEVPPGEWVLEPLLLGDPNSEEVPTKLEVPEGTWVLEERGEQDQVGTNVPSRVIVPSGVLVLRPLTSRAQVAAEHPGATDSPVGGQPLAQGKASLEEIQSAGGNVQEPLARMRLRPGIWELVPVSSSEKAAPKETDASLVPPKFFNLSGRRAVWAAGWDMFKGSPILGYGFHADRLLLRTHMHNAFMQALVQTGLIGTIPFVAAMLYGWFLFVRAALNLARFADRHKHMVIQVGGILAFLSLRALPESTGAFFGVDWLILAPLLLYLQVLNRSGHTAAKTV